MELDGQWRLSQTQPNPNPSAYAGVYESDSNWNVGGSTATMRIVVMGYIRFSLYIRSWAESSYDYCWCEAPTGTVVAEKSQEELEFEQKKAEYEAMGYYVEVYDDSGWVYWSVYDEDWTWIDGGEFMSTNPESTKGDQRDDTSIGGYKLVTYTFGNPAQNTIYVHYQKDGSVDDGDDRGYVLIPYVQEGG